MKMMSVLKAGVFSAVLSTAGVAAAVPLSGSVAIGAGSFPDTVTLDVRQDYSPLNNGVAGLNSSGVTGNFGGLGFQQSVVFSTFTAATPSTATTPSNFTITGTNFTFTASSVAVVQATENAADFFFLGNLATTASGFEGGNASFRASAVRNGAEGTFAVNFGGVLAAPARAVAVPEPASMALLGTGLLGLGLARRRRA